MTDRAEHVLHPGDRPTLNIGSFDHHAGFANTKRFSQTTVTVTRSRTCLLTELARARARANMMLPSGTAAKTVFRKRVIAQSHLASPLSPMRACPFRKSVGNVQIEGKSARPPAFRCAVCTPTRIIRPIRRVPVAPTGSFWHPIIAFYQLHRLPFLLEAAPPAAITSHVQLGRRGQNRAPRCMHGIS